MKTVSISGSPRANVGKKDAKALRTQGQVPCVLYGGKEQITFSAPILAFTKLVYTPEICMVKLDIGGKNYDAVMQDIQFDIVTDRLAHIDFLELVPGKSVTMNIPVTTKGSAAGVKEGGKLQKKTRTLKLRGPIEKIPSVIELDVTNLNIGDSIRVADIKFDGVSLLDPPNFTVVGVRVTRQVVEEVAAPVATTAAPAAGATTAAPAAEGAKKEEKKEEKKK
ncbi:MAG: 50S ribosomal protein L25 [Bacteroidia bacterium]|nr:50S ribosomal protein L25 [Bacteroidia bacterium]